MADRMKLERDDFFRQTYQQYYPFILKYCTARTMGDRELAEDCTQDAFFVLYKKQCDGVNFENPRAFLCRTADNILLKRKSKKIADATNRADYEEIEIVSIPNDAQTENEYKELLKVINECLDENEVELFRLRYFDDLSINEISQRLSISVSNTTTRISRLRKKIQAHLNNHWR